MGKRKYLILLLAFIGVMTLLAVFGENGLLHAFKLRRDLANLMGINERIRVENAQLAEEIEHLRNHLGYLEQQAHRQGMVREGEIIFQFRESP